MLKYDLTVKNLSYYHTDQDAGRPRPRKEGSISYPMSNIIIVVNWSKATRPPASYIHTSSFIFIFFIFAYPFLITCPPAIGTLHYFCFFFIILFTFVYMLSKSCLLAAFVLLSFYLFPYFLHVL